MKTTHNSVLYGDKANDGCIRFAILTLTLILTLNLLTRYLVVPAVTVALLVLALKRGLPVVLISIVIFGHALFALIKNDFGPGITHIIIGLTGLIFLILLLRYPGPSSSYNRKCLPNYLLWVFLLFLVMVMGYFLGPRTGYSLYAFQLFLYSAVFFILGGIMAAGYGIRIRDLILPSILLWSCSFPLMGFSVLQLPDNITSEWWGLRGIEGFAIIGQARLSGMLFILVVLGFITTPKKKRVLPEAFTGLLVSLPLLWYSYLRQAQAAVLITIVVIVVQILFRDNLVRTRRQKGIIFFLLAIMIVAAFTWGMEEIASTRMGGSGYLGVRAARYPLWINSLRYIEKSPLLGYGLGSFSSLGLGSKASNLPDWPHNWFIEAWLELGLSGLIIFIIGAVILLRPLFYSYSSRVSSWALLGLYYFIVIQLSKNIAGNTLILFFITVIALTKNRSFGRTVPTGSDRGDTWEGDKKIKRDSQIRVRIIQPLIPTYRVPFFRKLAGYKDMRVTVYASRTLPGVDNISSVDTGERHVDLEHTSMGILGNRLLWQKNLRLTPEMGPGDVLVISGNPYFLSNLPLIWKARKRRIGVIWWAHGSSKHQNIFKRLICRILLHGADVVLLYTDNEVNEYKKLGFPEYKLYATNNAIDQKPIKEAIASWDKNRLKEFQEREHIFGKDILLFCGRRTKSVSLEDVFVALSQLKKMNNQYLFVIIGPDDSAGALGEKTRELEVEDCVRWLGPIYDQYELAPWFLSARCFVFPGAIGLSLIHAFGYGLPVIVPDCAHNPEIAALIDGENGLFFREGDTLDLVEKITSITVNPKYRERLSKGALKAVRDVYNMDNMVARFRKAIFAASRISSQGKKYK